jgi:hypothetical protein
MFTNLADILLVVACKFLHQDFHEDKNGSKKDQNASE